MGLKIDKQGHILTLTLSRPEVRNAWDNDFHEGIVDALYKATDDDDVRVVVLTGDEAGGAFSAGANLKKATTHTTESAKAFVRKIRRPRHFAPNIMSDFPKPIIASVNGYAIGVGAIISLCCDLVVASEKAEWRLPQVQLGIIPNYGGATRVARFAGKGHAMRLALGFPLKAEEAYKLGIAQWLVPHAELAAKTREVAEHIANLPPLAVSLMKESLSRGMDIGNIQDSSLADSYRFMVLELTKDKDEAHKAWRERRKPTFKGE
jgi:enoyl-CoA hydratase/carnithine racemase